MKKKTEAVLKAIGLFLAWNVVVFGGAFILRWMFSSSIGHWLEIDRPNKAYVPGSFFVFQIFPLMLAIAYYRYKVKRQ